MANEERNFFRLSKLLIDVGAKTLREFIKLHTTADLEKLLNSNFLLLQKLNDKKAISKSQFELLFPQTKGEKPDLEKFDNSLLTVVIRNCIRKAKPVKSDWADDPDPTDTSPGAHIVRLRNFRNNLSHNEKASVSDGDFQILWKEISESILQISTQCLKWNVQEDIKNEIQEVGKSAFEMGQLDRFRKALECEFHEVVKSIHDTVRKTGSTVEEIQIDVKEMRSSIRKIERAVNVSKDVEGTQSAPATSPASVETKTEIVKLLVTSTIKKAPQVPLQQLQKLERDIQQNMRQFQEQLPKDISVLEVTVEKSTVGEGESFLHVVMPSEVRIEEKEKMAALERAFKDFSLLRGLFLQFAFRHHTSKKWKPSKKEQKQQNQSEAKWKTMYLFIDYKSATDEVYICFKRKEKDKPVRRKLEQIAGTRLWQVDIDIGGENRPKTYKYQQTWTTFGFPRNRMEEKVRYFDDSDVQRDILYDDSAMDYRLTAGIICHNTHILQSCCDNVKDSIQQLNYVKKINQERLLEIRDDVCCKMQKSLQDIHSTTKGTFVVFAAMIGMMYRNIQTCRLQFQGNLAFQILESFQNIPSSDIPKDSLPVLHNVCKKLMRIHYGEESSLLRWMSHTYPFQGESQFSQASLGTVICKNVKDEEINCAKFVCTTMMQRIVNGTAERGAEDLLNLLCQELPFFPAIEMYRSLFNSCFIEALQTCKSMVQGTIRNKVLSRLLGLKEVGNVGKLWKAISSEDYASDVKLHFESQMLKLLKAADSQAPTVGGVSSPMNVEVFLEEGLFETVQSQELILRTLAKAKRKDLHRLLLKFAETFGKPVDNAIVLTWFETAIEFHLEDIRKRKELSAYEYLHFAMGITTKIQKECEEHLHESFSRKVLRSFTILDLLALSADVDVAMVSSKADCLRSLYTRHVMELLASEGNKRNPNDMLCRVFPDLKQGEKIFIQTRLKKELTVLILETCELTFDENPLHMYRMLLHNYKFWQNILNTRGIDLKDSSSPCTTDLKDNIRYKRAEKCVLQVVSLLKNGDVKLASLKQIQKEELSKFKQLLETCDDYKHSKVGRIWDECESNLQRIEKEFELVRSVLVGVRRKLDGPEEKCISVLSAYIDNIYQTFTTGNVTIKEIKDETGYWKQHFDLLQICQNLQKYMNSNIYWTLVHEKLESMLRTHPEADLQKTEIHRTLEHENIPTGQPVRSSHVEQNATKESETMPSLQSSKLFFDNLCAMTKTYLKTWEPLFAMSESQDVQMSFVHKMFYSDDTASVLNIPLEIETIEQIRCTQLSDLAKNSLDSYYRFKDYEEKVEAQRSSALAFSIDINNENSYAEAVSAFQSLQENQFEDLTLNKFHECLQKIDKAVSTISKRDISIMLTLGKSSTLIHFLKTVENEDITHLINAVDEVSEQLVAESTINNLIEVKRFLQPLLSHYKGENVKAFIRDCSRYVQRCTDKLVESKIEDCMNNVHNLQTLYAVISNRGQHMVDIVQTINEKGTFCFEMVDNNCLLCVKYFAKKTITYKRDPHLLEFRSRALLMMSRDRKREAEQDELQQKEILHTFVKNTDAAFEIADLYSKLSSAGHFNYRDSSSSAVKKQLDSTSLEEEMEKVQADFNKWHKVITTCRGKHYWVNFFHGVHLQTLYSFLVEGKGSDENVQTLLNFIHPSISVDRLKHKYKAAQSNKSSVEMQLNAVADALDEICAVEMVPRPLPLPETSRKLVLDKAKKKNLLVVGLQQKSSLVIGTVFALYHNTVQRLPEANQVLFCNAWTTLEEMKLLLQRCVDAESNKKSNNLHCIAHVELLTNENQILLVEELRKLPQDENYLLAVIFRGPSHHPFVAEFEENRETVQAVSVIPLKNCFEKVCPNVFVVTSDFPGLGKTEFIRQASTEKSENLVSVHVSGPFNKKKLIERFADLSLNETSALHIDIGGVDNPEELDIFLFEIVMFRYVSAETKSLSLPNISIYIEVANTIQSTLRNSLQITMSFRRIHLTWTGYGSFKISSDLSSPVQTTCQYLHALQSETLEKTEIVLEGPNTVKPLSAKRCQDLLEKYFPQRDDMSFSLVHTFIKILADQLTVLKDSELLKPKFSPSDSEELGRLDAKLSDLVTELVHFAENLTRRAIVARKNSADTPKSDISKSLLDSAIGSTESMLERVEGMQEWKDRDMFIFSKGSYTNVPIPVYLKVDRVPDSVQAIFKSHTGKELKDMNSLSQSELQGILVNIAKADAGCLYSVPYLSEAYALTPDNILKMAVILMKIRANIPVIIMGDTGVGKTSLITCLAGVCGIDFKVFSIHAGIKEVEIINLVKSANEEAKRKDCPVWLFLDEINTNENIGLICDIICHRCLSGKDLESNLVVIGACNPYRKRTKMEMVTAGLTDKLKTDEMSKLVYRVHPLPEAMTDFVWDFGSLSTEHETSYIEHMVSGVAVKSNRKLLTELLVLSQNFMKKKYGSNSCVSLRDVDRCRDLYAWFRDDFLEKKRKYTKRHSDFPKDIEVRALILALAHCYFCRLPDEMSRSEYLREVATVIKRDSKHYEFAASYIAGIINEEQKDIVRRMKLPDGTAVNTALQENVFIILICILKRIPLFVVGKPGCSKSLAMQVIKSSVRGPDSTDAYFKNELPQLYCVGFQGSESSTSEGIIKVFERAKKYKEIPNHENVMPVVILDEIGLAELSRFNPLKVLHSLLEPVDEGGKLGASHLSVAVVGISNWALDASKMNRAITLSRPDMNSEELFKTAKSISASLDPKATLSKKTRHSEEKVSVLEKEMHGIAEAFVNYTEKQRFKNFHGLRDFYSLVKCVATNYYDTPKYERENAKMEIVLKGLQRNFSGRPTEFARVLNEFKDKLPELAEVPISNNSVLELTSANISDKSSRHLMCITTGDAALGIVEKELRKQGREYEVIFGSQFDEDSTDDYNYRTLSRIILCMDQGLTLILKDLDNIYGSLYDMLNQNYTEIGKKKSCRVALGAYNNQLCQVGDSFKCIVLVEESKLAEADPPFLSRFEKQSLRYADVLSEEENKMIEELKDWAKNISHLPNKTFCEANNFPIFSPDMVPSLVLHVKSLQASKPTSREDTIQECKDELLHIIKPEAILRLPRSCFGLVTNHVQELKDLENHFMSNSIPVHNGLEEYLRLKINQLKEGHRGERFLIFTHSSIHSNIRNIMKDSGMSCQVEKLAGFKSEKQLRSNFRQFWEEEDKHCLFIQCSSKDEGKHIMLAKSIIERQSSDFYKDGLKAKHACMVVHLGRTETKELGEVFEVNFLSGWKLVMLDSLDKPSLPLPKRYDQSLRKTLELERPLTNHIKEQLLWSFNRIAYSSAGKSQNDIKSLSEKIKSSAEFLKILDTAVLKWAEEGISRTKDKDWQIDVVCDDLYLQTSTCLIDALNLYIQNIIKTPLSKIIFELEKANALESYFSFDRESDERKQVWTELFNSQVFSITDTTEPAGVGDYQCSGKMIPPLKFPFSGIFYKRVEETKDTFMDRLQKLKQDENTDSPDNIPHGDGQDSLPEFGLMQQVSKENFAKLQSTHDSIVHKELLEVLELNYDGREDYIDDFCCLTSSKYSTEPVTKERVEFMKLSLKQKIDFDASSLSQIVTKLHTTFWVQSTLFCSLLSLFDTCKDFFNVEEVLMKMKKDEYQITSEVEESAESDQQSDAEGQPSNENEEIKTRQFEEDGDFTEGTEVNLQSVDDEALEPDEEIPEGDSEDQGIIDLIQEFCRQILPTSEVMKDKSDIERWNQKAVSILSIAGDVTTDATLVYGLKFCSDLASTLIIPHNLDSRYLKDIGQLLVLTETLDDDAFCPILETMIKELKGQVPPRDIHKVLSSYVLKCTGSNQSSALEWLLQLIVSDRVPDPDMSYLRLPVEVAIEMDIEEFEAQYEDGRNLLEDLIKADEEERDTTILENSNFLTVLDNGVRELSSKGQIDSPFIALMVDVLEQQMSKSLIKDEELENPTAATQESLRQMLLKTEDTLEKKIFSIRYLAAIAYFRRFTSVLFKEIDNKNIKSPEQYKWALQLLDASLSPAQNEQLRQSQLLFILRVLKINKTFNKLHKTCADLMKYVPSLKVNMFTDGFIETSPEGSPLALQEPEYYKEAVFHLKSFVDKGQNAKAVESLLKKAKDDSRYSIAVLSAFVSLFYLKQSRKDLPDSWMTGPITTIFEVAEKLQMKKDVLSLMKCLLRKSDFYGLEEILTLHKESEQRHVEMASFLVQIFVIVLARQPDKTSFFKKCILKPSAIKEAFVPGNPDSTERNSAPKFSEDQTVAIFDCPVGYKCAVSMKKMKHNEDSMCFMCKSHESVIKNSHHDHHRLYLALDTETEKGYADVDAELSYPPRQMSVVSYHLLQMILHGCLIGSVALSEVSMVSQRDLCAHIGVEKKEVSKYLASKIEEHWGHVAILTGMSHTEVGILLQVVLREATPLLCDEAWDFLTITNRNDWEHQFSQKMDEIIEKRFAKVLGTVAEQTVLHGLKKDIVENHVQECVSFDQDDTAEPFAPSLFRLTALPSVTGMISELQIQQKQAAFPFLALALERLDQILLLQYLTPLIEWHVACAGKVSYTMKRSGCSTFVRNILDKVDEKRLREKFRSCQEAWRHLRHRGKMMQKYNKNFPELELLTLDSRLEDCLVIDRQSKMYRVLDMLIGIQNKFLDDTMKLALSQHCSAVSFLNKDAGKSYIVRVPLGDMKKEELMYIKEEDVSELLDSSQCDLHCGYGRHILYDFGRIEDKLAGKLLFGKVHITFPRSFPMITFTDEAFSNYYRIIDELRDIIPQQNLDLAIVNKIREKQEEQTKISEALTHLAELIPMLKKVWYVDPEKLLLPYIEEWNFLRSRPFPESLLPTEDEKNIKVCHIVSLHELLEELNASEVLDSLDDDFRNEMGDPVRSLLCQQIEKNISLAAVTLRATKLFIHRCLRGKEEIIKELLECSLRDQIGYGHYWPPGVFVDKTIVTDGERPLDAEVPLEKLFSQEIMVKHVHEFVECVEEMIKTEKKQQPVRTARRTDPVGVKKKKSYNRRM